MISRPTLLIADAEAWAVDAIGSAADTAGLKVIVASNGVDALERFRESLPHIVLCDRMLGDMDGIQLTRKIGQCPTGRATPVSSTSSFTADLEVLGEELRLTDVLPKPFSADDVSRIIEPLLPPVDEPAWDVPSLPDSNDDSAYEPLACELLLRRRAAATGRLMAWHQGVVKELDLDHGDVVGVASNSVQDGWVHWLARDPGLDAKRRRAALRLVSETPYASLEELAEMGLVRDSELDLVRERRTVALALDILAWKADASRSAKSRSKLAACASTASSWPSAASGGDPRERRWTGSAGARRPFGAQSGSARARADLNRVGGGGAGRWRAHGYRAPRPGPAGPDRRSRRHRHAYRGHRARSAPCGVVISRASCRFAPRGARRRGPARVGIDRGVRRAARPHHAVGEPRDRNPAGALRRQSYALHLVKGNIVFARSNAPEHRLGGILLELATISKEEHARAVAAQGGDPKRRIGAILVAHGALSLRDLHTGLVTQVKRIVQAVVHSTRGSFAFVAEAPTTDDFIPIGPMPQLIVEACRTLQLKPEHLRHLPGDRDFLMRVWDDDDVSRLIALQANERTLLSQLGSGATMAALFRMRGLDKEDVLRCLYAFTALGVVQPVNGVPSRSIIGGEVSFEDVVEAVAQQEDAVAAESSDYETRYHQLAVAYAQLEAENRRLSQALTEREPVSV